jgi:FxsC-like protein
VSGRKRVRFIYVAAHPSRFSGLRSTDAYLDNGAGDWRPFYPADPRPVDPLVAQVATRDDLLFSYEERPFDDKLLQVIGEALERRQIVVIVVDPWTVYWDSLQPQPIYAPILRDLDQRIGYHWSVLVPDTDPECSARREDIYAVVRSTFDLHANVLRNPTFYRDGISSAAELQTVVAEMLTRLKEEINKRADVVRPVAPIMPRQTLSGPSAAQP